MSSAIALKPRSRPMEVLVLGLCRTGTFSMRTALLQLGYNDVHHMAAVVATDGESAKWMVLLKQKYEGAGGASITRAQFDDILGDCNAVTDMPSIVFARELLAMYPDAKVILTTRSAERWHASVTQTIYTAAFDGLDPILSLIRPANVNNVFAIVRYTFRNFFYGDFPRYGKRAFEEHNRMVRDLVPIEKLLVFEAKQGWEPLCEFLGKEVPEGEYPNLNDVASFRSNFIGNTYLKAKTIRKIGLLVLPVVVAGGFWWRRSML